ncbi:MAG TPA: DUF1194 domain-containing protein [Propylenella sp.]
MRIRMPVLTGLLCLAALGSPGAQEIDVDLELVLAVDVSRSMDATEQKLQKDGYIAALQHPEVVAAIRSGFLGRIAVTYVEWAGPSSHAIIAPWAMIDGPESAAAFASAIGEMPVSFLRGTSISGALTYTAGLFDDNGFRSTRQVIDVSGDGPNNVGFPVLQARAAVLERGITINGLPIMIHADYFSGYSIRDLDVYYEDCVIGGPGAFLITVESIDRIAEAIRRKLVLEIAGREPAILPAAFPEPAPRIDCLIGEKLRRRWMDP